MAYSTQFILEVEHLSVTYHRQPVLWDISFKIPYGKLVGIIGPNGAGKSTLIQAILNLVKRDTGVANFFTKPLEQVQRRVAYIPQKGCIDWQFPISVFDVVLMGRYGNIGILRRPTKEDRRIALECLELVGMKDLANRQISQLSGGQQQRIFIARALAQDADLFFLDEPFVGIDQATEKLIVDLLKNLTAQGRTICIIHHDLNTIHDYFDWLIMINMRLVACGPTAVVLSQESVEQTYGSSAPLLYEVLKRSIDKTQGIEAE